MSKCRFWGIPAGAKVLQLGWILVSKTKCYVERSKHVPKASTPCQQFQDVVDLANFTEASLRSFSGNGMSLACAGFVLLMTVLCVEDKK